MPTASADARPYLPDRAPRVGVLTNPDSRANRRQLDAVRALLGKFPAVLAREAAEPAAVVAALVELVRAEVELLVINAGDGTVGLILGALLEDLPPERLPLLCLVPGGNTSMDAGDVGQRGGQLRALKRVLEWSTVTNGPSRPAQRHRRDVLKVVVGDHAPARYGMFFGAGAILKGIEYCDQAVHSRGIGSSIGPGLCTLRVLLAMLQGDHSLVTPVPMRVASRPPLPQQRDGDDDTLVLLVSTLQRLFLGLHPYWGGGGGPLRLTAVRFSPPHVLRSLPPLLWGRPGRFATPENGYRSGRVDQVSLELDGPVTLDGEIYQAHRDAGPVRIASAGHASFLVTP